MMWIICYQDNDGLIDRWKRKNMENILELHNKTPVWNDGKNFILLRYVLPFHGLGYEL